jgi:hypothetical protein
LVGSEPPKGRKWWTLQLLEEQVVKLKIVDRASDNTIGRTLKNLLKPRLQQQWVIPPDANATFVRWHDPQYSVVCVDETCK